MIKHDINTGTRRRLLIAAPGAAALVLATRERGRAKSSSAKRRKKQKARAKGDALGRMSMELAGFTEPLTRLQQVGGDLQSIFGLESLGDEIVAITADLGTLHDKLVTDLAIARSEPTLS